jgi:hypothetical protein
MAKDEADIRAIIADQARVTNGFAKEKGAWKIVHIHHSVPRALRLTVPAVAPVAELPLPAKVASREPRSLRAP